ncbi:MAG: hypothetical protein C0603_04255 [Denitrovibrio sp.]|nr:MAG: hypothetical protein C0603_04255 [Denitrovibrio sp.]
MINRYVCVLARVVLIFMLATNFAFYPPKAKASSLVLEPLSLESILRELVGSNPEILEAIRLYESRRYEIDSVKSDYKPTVGTKMSVGQEVTDGVASNNKRENLTVSTAGIYAKQNLYRGGGTDNYVDETKAMVMSTSYNALDVANSVFLQTSENYLNMIKERELLKLANDNVYTQAQILDQIKQKTESGFGRQSDLLNSQSRLALARANLISQQQNLQQASVRLHKDIGRFVDPRQLILPEFKDSLGGDLDAVVDFAFENYPAIEVAKYNVLAKKYALKRTESLYLPTVDAELRADYANNTGGDQGDTKSYSAMLYLNYDFYDGGKRSADKKKNYSAILKEHERAYVERRNLNEAVRLAWNIKIAEEKKYKFLQEHVELNKQTLEAFKEEYQLGRRTLLELLDMENEYQRANKALVESKFATLVSHYRVLHITGILLYLYETDLQRKVGLNDKAYSLDMLKKYGDLDNNRDNDNVVDEFDQCDNSIFNSVTGKYGCEDVEQINVGYSKPDTVIPYIKPKEAVTLGDELILDEESLGDAESLGEPESTLEAEPIDELDAVGGPEERVNEVSLITPEEIVEEISKSYTIPFVLNSSRLLPVSSSLIEEIADKLSGLEKYKLEIIGHTDSSGRASFNQKLSAKRAKSVYNKLVKLGIDSDKIVAYGKGESEPEFSNRTRAGRKKNRRIELRLHLLNQQE